ncbi:hypothetical protein [Schleiferilactobacillus perolens]|uniref:hypothetical protein n=1 Tax=Schleiferilactobacillus perolens TaxID=100468 RepID=UPI002357A614|nr:hypothetical protein [Schleiferilactobacillus perolens]MCI2172280.1 hypothetical protein [Schleiferilactobacillus perolens]
MADALAFAEADADALVEALAETDVEAEALAEATAEALAEVDALVEALVLADPEFEAAGIVSLSFVANTSCGLTCLLVPTVVSAFTVDAPTAPPPIIPAIVAIPATSQRLPDLYRW